MQSICVNPCKAHENNKALCHSNLCSFSTASLALTVCWLRLMPFINPSLCRVFPMLPLSFRYAKGILDAKED